MAPTKKNLSSPVEVYALGGLGEVGKNLYCIEDENNILIIDCGVRFPDATRPGIDYILPDFTHLVQNKSKIRGRVITHGHEDHIGGIPFLLQQRDIPVIYAPKLAATLIRHKLEDNKLRTTTAIKEFDGESVIHLGDFKIEFFHVTHSIPDAYGLYITTPQGTIVETGDFKIDLTPVDEDFDLSKLVHFGDRGIDLLRADSTNAEKEGYTRSEKTVIQGIEDVFSEAPGRLIISTFSSNICRIQQIIETSRKFRRKIVIFGRSREANVDAAREFGYIKVPDEYLAGPDQLRTLPPNEVTILCTGNQGEPRAVLSRIARGEHRFIHVLPGDTVVFSSSVIPGNTAAINALINGLERLGAQVITNSVLNNLHASGHASRQERRLLQKLARPHYFMPVHGEYRRLKLHARIGVECGLSKDHTFVCNNGDVLRLVNHKVVKSDITYPGENIYIDGNNPVGITNAVIKERTTLINEGRVSVFVVIDPKRNRLVSSPVVESKGFITSNKKSRQKKASEIIGIEVTRVRQSQGKPSYPEIKNAIRNVTSHFLYRESKRRPIVIPVILNYSPAGKAE